MPKRRTTAAQRAASKRNLVKARAARKVVPRAKYTGKYSARQFQKKLADPSKPLASAGSRPSPKTKTRKDFASNAAWRSHLKSYKGDSASDAFEVRQRNDPSYHKSLAKTFNREASANRVESRKLSGRKVKK